MFRQAGATPQAPQQGEQRDHRERAERRDRRARQEGVRRGDRHDGRHFEREPRAGRRQDAQAPGESQHEQHRERTARDVQARDGDEVRESRRGECLPQPVRNIAAHADGKSLQHGDGRPGRQRAGNGAGDALPQPLHARCGRVADPLRRRAVDQVDVAGCVDTLAQQAKLPVGRPRIRESVRTAQARPNVPLLSGARQPVGVVPGQADLPGLRRMHSLEFEVGAIRPDDGGEATCPILSTVSRSRAQGHAPATAIDAAWSAHAQPARHAASTGARRIAQPAARAGTSASRGGQGTGRTWIAAAPARKASALWSMRPDLHLGSPAG